MFPADKAAQLKSLIASGSIGAGVFEVDDCRKTYEELKAKGVQFPEPPTKQPWGYAAVMKDDSGNYWSVGEES